MSDMQSHSPPDAPPKKGCIARNWKWMLGCGCLTGVLVCGGGVGVIFFGATWLIKSSDVYTESVNSAKADPQVIAALGEPVEEGFMPSGKFNTVNDSGEAIFQVSLSGPKGKGSLNVVATKSPGEPWQYNTFTFGTENGTVNIRKPR